MPDKLSTIENVVDNKATPASANCGAPVILQGVSAIGTSWGDSPQLPDTDTLHDAPDAYTSISSYIDTDKTLINDTFDTSPATRLKDEDTASEALNKDDAAQPNAGVEFNISCLEDDDLKGGYEEYVVINSSRVKN